MQINNTGHVVSNEGITTEPHRSPYWLGEGDHRIAFDYLVLDNDRVALHAIYGNALRQCHSEFFYDVIDSSKALASAQSLVAAAFSLLQAHNHDTEHDTSKTNDFLFSLGNDIARTKKKKLYIVSNS